MLFDFCSHLHKRGTFVPVRNSSSVIFNNCYQHLVWINADTPKYFGSFNVTASLSQKFNSRCAEDNPTCPKCTLTESASRGLRKVRSRRRWRQQDRSHPPSRPWLAQVSERAAIRCS